MEKNVRFYKCPICGNTIGLIHGNADNIICCGKPMELMVANESDGATEKHIPVYKRDNDKIIVEVGELKHPMDKEHYIMWIAQVSDKRTSRERLFPEQEAIVEFDYIPGSTIYAYCNKHGLWKTTIK